MRTRRIATFNVDDDSVPIKITEHFKHHMGIELLRNMRSINQKFGLGGPHISDVLSQTPNPFRPLRRTKRMFAMRSAVLLKYGAHGGQLFDLYRDTPPKLLRSIRGRNKDDFADILNHILDGRRAKR